MTHDPYPNISPLRWLHRGSLLEAPPAAMQLWGMGDLIHIEFIDHHHSRRRRRVNFCGTSFATVSGFGGRPQAHYRRHPTILAVVDVLNTSLTYCSDGGVRVTFIVDTVLVVCKTRVQCSDLTVQGTVRSLSMQSWNSQRVSGGGEPLWSASCAELPSCSLRSSFS